MSDISESEAREKAEYLASSHLPQEDITVKLASSGDSNFTYLADEQIVVKIEKTDFWNEEMRRETALLKKLSDEALKTPNLIDSGTYEESYYRIIEFVEGETLDRYSEGRVFKDLEDDVKERLAYRVGEKLAQVHETRSFDRFGRLEIGEENIENISAGSWFEGLNDIQSWWYGELRENGFGDEADEIKRSIDELEGEIKEVEESRLLHMEFGLRNLIFQENDIVPLDWEVAVAGDPMLDLIMTEMRLVWMNEESETVRESFREGYQSVRDLELSEKLELVYKLVQMTRFLAIFRNNDGMRERVKQNIEELTAQVQN